MSTERKWLFVRVMVLLYFPFCRAFQFEAEVASDARRVVLFVVWLAFVALVVLAYRFTLDVRREGLNRRPVEPGHRCTFCGDDHAEEDCALPDRSLRRRPVAGEED